MRPARIALSLLVFLLALAILLAPFVAIPAQAQTPTNPGTTNLAACWDFDEESGTREDAYGANDLTDNNTVGSTTGKVGSSAQFVAANSEYLSISDNSSLSVTGEFTLGGWVYLDTDVNESVIRKTNEYYLWVNSNTFFRVGTTGSVAGTDLVISQWYFVVGRYNGTTAGTANLFVNTNVFTNTITAPSDTTNGVYIGQNGAGTTYWNGRIDQMFLYNGRALTNDEISWLYNNGDGRSCDDIIAPAATNTPTATATATATATGAPTATPTPGAERELTLSSGDTATIVRDFSYGEILVAFMIGLLIVVIVIAVIWMTVKGVFQ